MSGGVDVNGDGFQDMDPEATREVMGFFHESGANFDLNWSSQQGPIAAHAAALGKPHLGPAFKQKYDPLAAWVTEVANTVAATVLGLSSGGLATVADYVATEQASAERIQRQG